MRPRLIRLYIPLRNLIALGSVLCLNACNDGGDKSAKSEPAPASQVQSQPTEQPAKAEPPAIVDAAAVDDDGLIVLNPQDAVPAENQPKLPAQNQPKVPAQNQPKVPAEDQPKLPVESNVATASERDQTIAADWPKPQAVIFVSGQQHGYIEPCGCTGLENQKGGLIRRDTLLKELRERGWELVPVDVGNQVRRTGRQAEIKFQTTVEALKQMGYQAAALGIDDLKLATIELVQNAAGDSFLSANVVIWGEPSYFPSHRVVESGGRKIGITAVLGNDHKAEFEKMQNDELQFFDPVEKLKPVVELLDKEGCDFKVLLAHASLEESAELARQVPGFDLVVTAGGFGEPTLTPESIADSTAVMVQVGTKGMYGGIIGIYPDDAAQPIRYQKIAISSQFKDSPRMLAEFAAYQQRLADAGFAALGCSPLPHPTNRKFVGSEVCSDCHSSAFAKWQETPHFHATDSIIRPDNDRGNIARDKDPECVSCHVTGWNPQKFFPYEAGFLSREETPLMMGSGCENCHGPGSDHVAAELGDIDVTSERLKELQQQMILPLASARDKCLECHDLDNSPDFDFDSYWEQVKHYGKD